MGLVSGLITAGVAKKVLDQARRPENQQRARELFAQVRSKGGRSQRPAP